MDSIKINLCPIFKIWGDVPAKITVTLASYRINQVASSRNLTTRHIPSNFNEILNFDHYKFTIFLRDFLEDTSSEFLKIYVKFQEVGAVNNITYGFQLNKEDIATIPLDSFNHPPYRPI